MSAEDAQPTLSAGQRLPIARYRFTAIAAAPLVMPHYAGSLLRGAFGAALRRSACMTNLPRCSGCPLYRTCPYPAIFETPPRPTPLQQNFTQVPNPYVIEPPPPGERLIAAGGTLSFCMVLVGDDTLAQLPLIAHAWTRALAHGLGRDRVVLRLTNIEWCGEDGTAEPVFDGEAGRVAAHEVSLSIPEPPEGMTGLTLHIRTPLRLQHQGRAIGPRELDARTLILAAVRRATLVLHLHCGRSAEPDMEAVLRATSNLREDRAGLHWMDWTRYSSRQRQEMTLGGVLGPWLLDGDLGAVWKWLWLGEWLHLGKNATMGLGAYRLETRP